MGRSVVVEVSGAGGRGRSGGIGVDEKGGYAGYGRLGADMCVSLMREERGRSRLGCDQRAMLIVRGREVEARITFAGT